MAFALVSIRRHHVVLGDVNLEGAEKSAKSINGYGGSASAVKLNVTQSSEVRQAFDSISKDFKAVDILINNAGITKDRRPPML